MDYDLQASEASEVPMFQQEQDLNQAQGPMVQDPGHSTEAQTFEVAQG